MSRLEIVLFFTLLRPYVIPCRSSIIAEKLSSQALGAIPKIRSISLVKAVWPLRCRIGNLRPLSALRTAIQT